VKNTTHTPGGAEALPQWPHVTALLDAFGHVTLGRVEPMAGVAIAANPREVVSVLRRRPKESAAQLMQRLEEALAAVSRGGAPVNEVGNEFVLSMPSAVDKRSDDE
jgi:hypothetical protein